jgi:hypothetical protein
MRPTSQNAIIRRARQRASISACSRIDDPDAVGACLEDRPTEANLLAGLTRPHPGPD